MLDQGIHDRIPMSVYLADPCAEPSLSTGVVDAILGRSELHAKTMHPRFGGNGGDNSSRADLGSAVHSMILGGADVAWIPFDDYRKDAAKTLRDEAYAAGKIPLLSKLEPAVSRIVESGCKALNSFGPGKAEQTMIWKDGGVWCRGRADFLTEDGKYDLDIKTTENASPEAWIRSTLYSGGYHIQAGLRARGHYAINGRNRDVLFLLVEIEPPYDWSVVALDPAAQDVADRSAALAIDRWRKAIQAQKWPGYDKRIHYAAPPAWLERSLAERSVA